MELFNRVTRGGDAGAMRELLVRSSLGFEPQRGPAGD
jgi:hypothetical protein